MKETRLRDWLAPVVALLFLLASLVVDYSSRHTMLSVGAVAFVLVTLYFAVLHSLRLRSRVAHVVFTYALLAASEAINLLAILNAMADA